MLAGGKRETERVVDSCPVGERKMRIFYILKVSFLNLLKASSQIPSTYFHHTSVEQARGRVAWLPINCFSKGKPHPPSIRGFLVGC
jgi:hypothetical protein